MGKTETENPCRWMADTFLEICTNADCPMCADGCPVPDTPGVCRYEDRSEEEKAP